MCTAAALKVSCVTECVLGEAHTGVNLRGATCNSSIELRRSQLSHLLCPNMSALVCGCSWPVVTELHTLDPTMVVPITDTVRCCMPHALCTVLNHHDAAGDEQAGISDFEDGQGSRQVKPQSYEPNYPGYPSFGRREEPSYYANDYGSSDSGYPVCLPPYECLIPDAPLTGDFKSPVMSHIVRCDSHLITMTGRAMLRVASQTCKSLQ